MGLLQKAVETYDAMKHLAGKIEEGKEPLAPIGHIIKEINIVITIDKNGDFIQADQVKQKVIIPVSEASAGRSGTTVSAHPLCEAAEYISGSFSDKYDSYMKELETWKNYSGNPKLSAIYEYVSKKELRKDIEKSQINYKDKLVIGWSVLGLGDECSDVWSDIELQKTYTDYYIKKENDLKRSDISMISGKTSFIQTNHSKTIVSTAANAKIISSNDKENFTYRGRFIKPEEALSITYIDSQKAHNALKWIVATQGTRIGNRTYICWNPKGKDVPKPHSPLLFQEEEKRIPSDYSECIKKVISGYKTNLPKGEGVIIASLEATTDSTGRLSITYYNELQGSDFLDRLQYWDETCCWYDNRWGTSSPSLYNIVRFAFGNQQGEKVVIDDRVISQNFQRLIACRVDKSAFPRDIMQALMRRNDNPEAYNKSNLQQLMFITCAVIKKYRNDRFKEVWDMALEPGKKDRSYQFGRLLAVLEKAEKDTYDNNENRETNAIRMQSVFVRRPAYAAKIILEQVKSAYYGRLKAYQKAYYERLIEEIMGIISEFEEDYNKPLSETYLLGYYLQKNEFYTKKESTDDEEVE